MLDFHQRRVGVRNVPADDRVATRFQSAGQFHTHRLGDAREVLSFGDPLHAVDLNPGQVVAAPGDEGVAMHRLQFAEGGEGLLQGE